MILWQHFAQTWMTHVGFCMEAWVPIFMWKMPDHKFPYVQVQKCRKLSVSVWTISWWKEFFFRLTCSSGYRYYFSHWCFFRYNFVLITRLQVFLLQFHLSFRHVDPFGCSTFHRAVSSLLRIWSWLATAPGAVRPYQPRKTRALMTATL